LAYLLVPGFCIGKGDGFSSPLKPVPSSKGFWIYIYSKGDSFGYLPTVMREEQYIKGAY